MPTHQTSAAKIQMPSNKLEGQSFLSFVRYCGLSLSKLYHNSITFSVWITGSCTTRVLRTQTNWNVSSINHSTDDSTPILLAFYWWLYSHSTDDSTPILLMILFPFRFHSTDDSTPILLAFYWWFYFHSTPILLVFYWWFHSHSARILLMILLPFYSHYTDDSTPILCAGSGSMPPFYWSLSTIYVSLTCMLLMILLLFYRSKHTSIYGQRRPHSCAKAQERCTTISRNPSLEVCTEFKNK